MNDNDEYIDPLYDKGVEIFKKNGRLTVCGLQRYLGVGYNRAVRMIERMKKDSAINEHLYIEVACLVLPTGKNLWFKTSEGIDYAEKVLDKWKKEHPEFNGTPCTSGMVTIKMRKSDYIAISASVAPGCFEFPSVSLQGE